MLVFNDKLKTAPVNPVVSLPDLKGFLKIDNNDDDTFLELLIQASTQRCEEYLSLKFITQTWLLYLDGYPMSHSKGPWWDGVRQGAIASLTSCEPEMVLPFGPLRSVVSINSMAADGQTYLYDSNSYGLDTVAYRGRILLKDGFSWPSMLLQPANGVVIEATFGFGDNATDVPAPIVHAVKLLCAKIFENRGDVTESEFFGVSGFTMPNTIQMLLEPYRQIKVG